jgi:tRNA nucleotidyltransferase (CCA-adding enzyme)
VSAVSTDLRERIRRVPGMDRLLPALEGLPPVYLVGGAVRDLLRRGESVDVDLVVEGDARPAARALAERIGGQAREHDRFGTATVRAGNISFDLATSRRERYERPGALPTVEPAPLLEDLGRRDFTINAMAAGLTGDDLGHLYDPHGGFDDLHAGVVRVLHDASFIDDPTRLLRALRYEARLGFGLEADTEALARKAAAADALQTVSGARVRDELLDLLGELDAPRALERLHELGIDHAMHPALEADPELVASAALGAVAIGADRALAGLAALVSGAPAELDLWLADLHLRADERDAVSRAARAAPRLVAELRRELKPSELYDLLHGEPAEALALALAMRAPSEPVLRYVTDLRPVRLEVSGADLIAEGLPESPALGEALRAVLRRKLDGELTGRDAELAAALEEARP